MGRTPPSSLFWLVLGLCLDWGLVSTQVQEEIRLQIDPVISADGMLKVPHGSQKIVTCRADVPNPDLVKDMKWYWHTGDEVKPSDGRVELITHEKGTLGLYFSSVQDTETGKFKCTATYANTHRLEVEFTLGLFLPITFEEAQKNQYATKNEEFKIKCVVKSDPIATVVWRKDHHSIADNPHYLQDTDGLIIKEVTEADEGVYECRATVLQLGNVKSEHIVVQVQEKPKITSIITDVEGVEGENIHMKCSGTGKPTPEVEWVHTRDGTSLYGKERHVVDKNKGTLEINGLRVEDRGQYYCRLRNQAGVDEAITELTIVTKPKIEEYNNITTQIDGKAVLVCRASGNPAPDIVFHKDSRREPFIQGSQNDVRIFQEQSRGKDEITTATLTINDILRDDDGLYNCIASNRRARTEKMGHLTVEFPPTFQNTPMVEAWTWDGKAANLTCRAEAIPNATIAWYLEGNPERQIQEGPNIRRYGLQSESTLEIRPIGREDYGHYKCVATNKISTAQHTIQFKEALKPGTIRQVLIKSVTATTISFEIAGPPDNGGLQIDSYVIQYKLQAEPWENAAAKSWPVEETLVIIEGLEPTYTYAFRFAARNLVGVGEFSQEKVETMPRRTAPEPPTILTEVSDGHVYTPYTDRVEIKWAKPQDNGAPVDQYEVTYIPVTNGTTGQIWESYGSKYNDILKDPTALSHTLQNLSPNTYYKVEVRAHNLKGWGETSQLIVKTAGSGDRGSYDSMKSAQANAIGLPLIIAISVSALIFTLIIVDFACCRINQRGIIYAMSTKMCSKKKAANGGSDISKGSINVEKQPIPDDHDHGFPDPEDLQIHQPFIPDGSGKTNGSHGQSSTNTMV